MRIQILPLTPVRLGDAEHTPFIVVLDRLSWSDEDDLHLTSQAFLENLKAETGTLTVVVADQLDAPGSLELTSTQKAVLLSSLGLVPPEPIRIRLAERNIVDADAETLWRSYLSDPYSEDSARFAAVFGLSRQRPE